MKVLGLACGRKMGNCEIILKEALMAVEEMGADVEIVRMLDLDIKACRFCQPCPAELEGADACILNDDIPFIKEKLVECDGLIVSAPVYTLTPPGYYKLLCDRTGTDVSFLREGIRQAQAAGGKVQSTHGGGRPHPVNVDERLFKPRVGAFISVGGAMYNSWIYLALPTMHFLTFSRQIKIVDQMQVLRSAAPGSILLQEDTMKKARQLGKNVAEALGKSFDEIEYKGDDPGMCPICHTNLMIMGQDSTVECVLCGIKGNIKVENGKTTVVFPEEEQKKSRLTLDGRVRHLYEIQEVARDFAPRQDEIPPMLEKYKSYKSYSKPPRRKRKKATT